MFVQHGQGEEAVPLAVARAVFPLGGLARGEGHEHGAAVTGGAPLFKEFVARLAQCLAGREHLAGLFADPETSRMSGLMRPSPVSSEARVVSRRCCSASSCRREAVSSLMSVSSSSRAGEGARAVDLAAQSDKAWRVAPSLRVSSHSRWRGRPSPDSLSSRSQSARRLAEETRTPATPSTPRGRSPASAPPGGWRTRCAPAHPAPISRPQGVQIGFAVAREGFHACLHILPPTKE